MADVTALVSPIPTAPTSPTGSTRIDDLIECENSIGEAASVEESIIEEENEEHPIPKVVVKDTSLRGKISDYWQKFNAPRVPPPLYSSRPNLVRRIDEYPKGYPQLAAFINSADDFMITRKFGFLRARVLLYRQDELSVLERDLIRLDEDDFEKRGLALASRKHDEATDKDPKYSRKVLIKQIDDKLKEYDDLVSRIKIYIARKDASSRATKNSRSFRDWIVDHNPLSLEETLFLGHTDDFVHLSDGDECGWLDDALQDGLTKCLPDFLMKRIFSSHLPNGSGDKNLHVYDARRIGLLVRFVLVLMVVGLLVGPSAILFFVPRHGTLKICLIMVFTLLFAAALSVCTKAKRHEMLAATATYAAVLVVFLGNITPGSLAN